VCLCHLSMPFGWNAWICSVVIYTLVWWWSWWWWMQDAILIERILSLISGYNLESTTNDDRFVMSYEQGSKMTHTQAHSKQWNGSWNVRSWWHKEARIYKEMMRKIQDRETKLASVTPSNKMGNVDCLNTTTSLSLSIFLYPCSNQRKKYALERSGFFV